MPAAARRDYAAACQRQTSPLIAARPPARRHARHRLFEIRRPRYFAATPPRAILLPPADVDARATPRLIKR